MKLVVEIDIVPGDTCSPLDRLVNLLTVARRYFTWEALRKRRGPVDFLEAGHVVGRAWVDADSPKARSRD